MPEDITFLAVRSAFMFKPDQLYMAKLSSPEVIHRIQEAFEFQSARPAVVSHGFGSATSGDAVGLTFNRGVFRQNSRSVVVEEISFDPSFVVIRITDESSWLDLIYAALRNLFGMDQPPIRGDYMAKYHHSELSAMLSLGHEVVAPLWYLQAMGSESPDDRTTFGTLVINRFEAGVQYPGDNFYSWVHQWMLSPRAGSKTEDRLFFSSAPLDSRAHVEFLARIEELHSISLR